MYPSMHLGLGVVFEQGGFGQEGCGQRGMKRSVRILLECTLVDYVSMVQNPVILFPFVA